MTHWSVYLLRCRDGSIYTGISTDVRRRMGEHESGKKGAKFLRGKGPLELVYERQVGSQSTATRLENRIKRLPSTDKSNTKLLPRRIEALLAEIEEASADQ